MKIGIAQTHIVSENEKLNLKTAKEYISEAAQKGCRMVLFCEMSFTGFDMRSEANLKSGEYILELMKTAAVENHIAVGFGWAKKVKDKFENHYTIVDQDASIVSDYVKIHPFSFGGEDKFFSGGEKIVLFRLDDIDFSTFICYDLRFPEVFMEAATKAHVILVPSCWPLKRDEHRKILLRARAIENQVYILGINCVNETAGIVYGGESCIVNPDGEVHFFGSDEGLYFAEINDDVDRYREEFPVLKDRKAIALKITP